MAKASPNRRIRRKPRTYNRNNNAKTTIVRRNGRLRPYACIARRSSLADTSATKVTLPFVEEQLKAAKALMGEDYWSYGVAANRNTLEAFVRHHHGQGLSSRLMDMDEIFHPATYETVKI